MFQFLLNSQFLTLVVVNFGSPHTTHECTKTSVAISMDNSRRFYNISKLKLDRFKIEKLLTPNRIIIVCESSKSRSCWSPQSRRVQPC